MNPNQPRRHSKFESLVKFLEDHENGIDSCKRLADGSNSDSPHGGAGLFDITNVSAQSSNEPTAEKLMDSDQKNLQSKSTGSNDRKSAPTELISKKSYTRCRRIWDTWEEESLDQRDATKSLECKYQTAGESRAEKMSLARQQILDIQEASREISTRAAKLKADQEQLKTEVERLHSIRIQNEANHVKAMKKLKLEFKDRRAAIEAKSEQVTNEQLKVQNELTSDCQKLEQKESRLTLALDKLTSSESETCERMYREGANELQHCKKSWRQAEENDLKNREKKLAPKLRKDAAKKVEPRLRQLMEENTEELARLQRQSARELDSYKMELHRKMNKEFRAEANRIRETEREQVLKLEGEWMMKVEQVRVQNCDALNKTTKEHEQRMQLIKQQHNIQIQRLTHDQEVAMEDAKRDLDSQLEDETKAHERIMAKMDADHKDKLSSKRIECKLEFEKWCRVRGNDLLKIEEAELKQAEEAMKDKINAELDRIANKLNEEAREKRELMSLDANLKTESMEAAFKEELKSIQTELNKAQEATSALNMQEKEAQSKLVELKQKVSSLQASIHEKEDSIIVQESSFKTFVKSCDQAIADKKKDADRKIMLANQDLTTLEEELNRMIATHPVRLEAQRKDLDSLKAQYRDEIQVANDKVSVMLERKRKAVEETSARLSSLVTVTAQLEKQIDEARASKILGINRQSK